MPRLDITTRATARMLEDPVVFSLGGARLSGGEWREEFTAIPALGIAAIRVLGDAALRADALATKSTRPGAPTIGAGDFEGLALIAEFFDAVLGAEDAARFRAIVEDKDYLVDVEDIRAAVEFVTEALSARPTNGQPSSPDGLSNTASTSTANSSSPATPRLPSLPSPPRTSSPSPSPSTFEASSAPSNSTGSSSSSNSVSLIPPQTSKPRTRATPPTPRPPRKPAPRNR